MSSKSKRNNSILDDARKEALRQFRHSLKQLKKAGLVSKKYDLRKQKPTKYLKSVIKKYSDVLSGQAKVVKVPTKKKQQQYKDVGYKTRGAKQVIVPVDPNQKVRVNKKGDIVRTRTLNGGTITEVFLPIKYENLEQWLHDAKDADLDKLKKKDESWAFNFFGKNSTATFSNIDLMIEYLEEYQSIQKAINIHSNEDMDEIYRHISIFKVTRKPGVWTRSPREPQYNSARRRAAYERAKMRIENMTDEQYEAYAEREREKRAARYRRIKEEQPEKYQKILEQARAAKKRSTEKRNARKRG